MKTTILLVSFVLLNGCNYNPTYTTTQGVDVFEDCVDCPSRESVEDALEYYATMAPDVLGWNSVRSDFKGMRLFVSDTEVEHGCWQSDVCGGTVFPTGIGADVFLWVERCVSESDLYTEITKYYNFLKAGQFDYDYSQQEEYWGPNSVIINGYLDVLYDAGVTCQL